MSKHTPGPWEIKAHSDPCYRNISGPEHLALAQVVWRVEEEDRSPKCEANARLIAAAPDLLEALEKMVGLFEPGRVYDFKEVSALTYEALSIALSALAKARGKEMLNTPEGS